MSGRSALDAAYRATRYRVYLPVGTVDLRVGEPAPVLDAWLASEGLAAWGLITAVNPGSRRLGEAANRARQRALAGALAAAGERFCAGENLADAGDWPAEPSFLVLGLEAAQAFALGARFGQQAVLAGRLGEAPQLLWIDR